MLDSILCVFADKCITAGRGKGIKERECKNKGTYIAYELQSVWNNLSSPGENYNA